MDAAGNGICTYRTVRTYFLMRIYHGPHNFRRFAFNFLNVNDVGSSPACDLLAGKLYDGQPLHAAFAVRAGIYLHT